MNWTELFPVLEQAFDAGQCQEYLRGIWENDRWFTTPAFAKTAAACESWMREAGLSQVERLPLSADGRTAYGDWVLPRAWDVDEAVLELPDGTRLADYRQVPCSLVMHSAPSPEGGVRAGVLRVEDPDAADPASVAGKLLFTNRPARELIPLAVSGGAAGILSEYFPLYPGVRDNLDGLDEISRWDNDFKVPVNDTGLFAFSLSPRNANRLRAEMEKGPVTLYARVDTRFYDGECSTVSGLLPGSDPEAGEILLYGHLYEPGAEDNGSGCAMLLELARSLTRLVAGGALPQPRRGIRFVMGYECVGSMGYLTAHPDRKHLCGIVADMVGTEAVDRAHLGLWHDPISNWSFADIVLPAIVRDWQKTQGRAFFYEERPFSVGSDNIMADPAWGFPTMAMITEPAFSYHSSLDTPERIEPEVLRRNGVLLGAAALWLAAAGANEADGLALRLQKEPEEWLEAYPEPLREFARRSALASLERFSGGWGIPEEASIPPMPEEARAMGGARVPVREVPGCLTFAANPQLAGGRWKPAWNDALNCPLFWADGRRTLWEIAVLSAWEQKQIRDGELWKQFVFLQEYFAFLQENSFLSWKTSEEGRESRGI